MPHLFPLLIPTLRQPCPISDGYLSISKSHAYKFFSFRQYLLTFGYEGWELHFYTSLYFISAIHIHTNTILSVFRSSSQHNYIPPFSFKQLLVYITLWLCKYLQLSHVVYCNYISFFFSRVNNHCFFLFVCLVFYAPMTIPEYSGIIEYLLSVY